jgi:nicotinate-nucleotide pyrophosphorylase (carboxylating)
LEEAIISKFLDWLREDIPYWDVTSEAVVPRNIRIKAEVVSKSDGVIACIDEAIVILTKLGIRVKRFFNEGDEVHNGTKILQLEGNARKILAIERTLLNILSHCSGVATTTKKLIKLVHKINPRVKIAATRKTLPGLRYFEKKAVLSAGGDTHRLTLSDMLLIKDNHIKIVGDLETAIKLARAKSSFSRLIEVEVTSPEEAIRAAKAGAHIIMLDNFTPEEVKIALELLEKHNLRKKVLIEVSGGIKPSNIIEYARLDVDIISCGWITHSAPALDLSLDVVEVIK